MTPKTICEHENVLAKLYRASVITCDTLEAIANTHAKNLHYTYMDIVLALIIRKRQESLSREQLCKAIKLYFRLLEYYTFNLF